MKCALLCVGLFSVCCGYPESLEIATTTSVVNSGLLDAILPHFEGVAVRVHAAGSGRALAMLADERVGLVISHAPNAEQDALLEHPNWRYRKLAFNRFIVVGPSTDPASVRSSTDAIDAFKRIATSQTPFVSRGDSSGTHEREQILWALDGTAPSSNRYLVSGGSMAITLRQADNRLAYTLSDDATWHQLQSQLRGLGALFVDDNVRLLNSYAVIYRNDNVLGAQLAGWLTEGRGRDLIAAFRIGDFVPFSVWPSNCPNQQPTDLPCAMSHHP